MAGVEDRIQTECIRWFGLQYPSISRLLHHSPNGGRRDYLEAVKFKRMGVRAGFPDLFLYVPRKGYHGLAIELKTDTGKQQKTQKEMQLFLEGQGYKYLVVRSVESFIAEVNGYLRA